MLQVRAVSIHDAMRVQFQQVNNIEIYAVLHSYT